LSERGYEEWLAYSLEELARTGLPIPCDIFMAATVAGLDPVAIYHTAGLDVNELDDDEDESELTFL
jgi:hypothetical protein